jgi:hypothetical protein
LLIFITDIHALGLKTAPIFQQPQGYIFGYEANLPIDYDLRLFQPTAVGNERRLDSIVLGLLFTMNSATPTC